MDKKKKSEATASLSNTLLWDRAINQSREKRAQRQAEESSENDGKNLLIIGGQQSGKSSLILNFTERGNEIPKPTIALDYTFCRKMRVSNSNIKDIGNIWEVGEGIFLKELINVVINKDTVFQTSVILTVDLSKLNELWFTMEILLNYFRKRVSDCVKLALDENKKLKEKLQVSLRRVGENPDKKSLDLVEIPFAIIATKYDQFERVEPEKRKIVCKSLRFVAHYYGAMLMFTSNTLEASVNKSKALMNNFLFEGSFNNKQLQVDHMKPLFIPFGSDTFESIGQAPLSASELNGDFKTPVDLWKQVFCKNFPQEETKKDPSLMIDHGNDPQFAEPVIDSLRDQKIREFDNLRELLKRRRNENKSIQVQIIS